MRIACSLVTPVVLILGVDVMAAELPTPLNFRNLTAGRIQPNVAEDGGNNVKEVGFGDIDNDGDDDVVVGAAGGIFGLRRNKLYRNDNGVFVEISGAPVISGFSVLDLTRHVFIKDYDGDGWNDIVIANDDLAGGGPFKIYMNQHPGDVFSHFVEEGAARGLGEQASCGAVSVDLDNDGDWDLYSGNYPGPSQDAMYLNDGNGNFTTTTFTHVPDDGDYTIDVAAGDLNDDGKLDLLISNHNPNYVYYNDKQSEGDHGVGDYKYGPSGYGGRQNLGNNGADGAMECGDFNNDGRMDFYYSNKFGVTGDRIMMNLGNDANGMATFVEVLPPSYVTSSTGNKITVGDLNADGRDDILVGMVGGRPAVLRNTSVNGVISFVDWSPGSATAFPSGTTHQGHHGAMFDTNNDGDIDIFMGARNGDFLFENVPSPSVDEDDLGAGGGMLAPVLNEQARAVYGRSAVGESDVYTAPSLTNGSFISIVLNGPDDYVLEVLSGTTVVATSDRGGIGIEEAIQYPVTSGGNYDLRVTINGCGAGFADINGDCEVNVDDLIQLILDWGALGGASDINNDDIVSVDDLVPLLLAWGPVQNEYLLELMAHRVIANRVHLILAGVLASGCGHEPQPPAPANDQPTASISSEVDAVVASMPAVPVARPLDEALQPAVIMIGRRQFDEARTFIEHHRATRPNDGQALFLLGLTHHKQGNYAKARPFFEQSLELAPDFPSIHHFFGYCLYNLGELDAAGRQFELHLRSDPREGDSHFGLGLVRLDEGRLDDAEASFRTAIALTKELRTSNPAPFRARQPDLAKCHARLADVHLARNDHVAARDALLETIRIYPAHYQAYYKLGLAYRHLGEDELADRAMADHERVRNQVRPGGR